jgi:hypothetical protein
MYLRNFKVVLLAEVVPEKRAYRNVGTRKAGQASFSGSGNICICAGRLERRCALVHPELKRHTTAGYCYHVRPSWLSSILFASFDTRSTDTAAGSGGVDSPGCHAIAVLLCSSITFAGGNLVAAYGSSENSQYSAMSLAIESQRSCTWPWRYRCSSFRISDARKWSSKTSAIHREKSPL